MAIEMTDVQKSRLNKAWVPLMGGILNSSKDHPDVWVCAYRTGGLASLFTITWYEEGEVWHVGKAIVDLHEPAIDKLKEMFG